MTNLQTLQSFKVRLVEYLILKVEQEDWHGVADAAMDVREVDAKIALLKELEATGAVKISSPYIPKDQQKTFDQYMTEYAIELSKCNLEEHPIIKYGGKL